MRREGRSTSKVRTAWYEKHGISRERYYELVYICSQYDEYRREDLRFRRGEIDCKARGNSSYAPSDPTGNTASSWADNRAGKKKAAIEAAAKVSCGELAKFMLAHVAKGKPVETLHPPCGEKEFYNMRRMFFAALHELWEKI